MHITSIKYIHMTTYRCIYVHVCMCMYIYMRDNPNKDRTVNLMISPGAPGNNHSAALQGLPRSFPQMEGIPQKGWFIMEHVSINRWFGGTPISGNPHIMNYWYDQFGVYIYIYVHMISWRYVFIVWLKPTNTRMESNSNSATHSVSPTLFWFQPIKWG